MSTITLTPDEKVLAMHALSHRKNNAHVREQALWIGQSASMQIDTLTAALVLLCARSVCKCEHCYATDEYHSISRKRYKAHHPEWVNTWDGEVE